MAPQGITLFYLLHHQAHIQVTLLHWVEVEEVQVEQVHTHNLEVLVAERQI
jgi:hypothetical protein